MKTHEKASLLIVGVYQATEAYPNTLHRVRKLLDSCNAHEINKPLWSNPTDGRKSATALPSTAWRIIKSHLRIAASVIGGPRYRVSYIPYPAPSVALMISLMPARWRPQRIVLDGFISLYDTIVNDRKIWNPDTLKSKVLRSLERRSFLRSDCVIVDTPQNGDFYSKLFAIPREHFHALPLATNEIDYVFEPYEPSKGRCKVLFIGTLVPLHGISTIIDAARLLSNDSDIEFHILGDGSEGNLLEAAAQQLTNVHWKRGWHSASQLAQSIRESDICLGIFGSTAKAQRVCPYKLYSYASIGRATVTGDTEWTRSITEDDEPGPFHTVPVNDPPALADAIRYLADNQGVRAELSQRAHSFYGMHLSNENSFNKLADLLFDTE